MPPTGLRLPLDTPQPTLLPPDLAGLELEYVRTVPPGQVWPGAPAGIDSLR